MNFRQSNIIVELWRPDIARRRNKINFLRFWNNDPLWGNFRNSVPIGSSRHRSTCCVQISWNFACRKTVKSCVSYLTKKKQNFALWLSSSWYCADRVQNLPGPGLLKVLHISSKAVNFRRSYIESVNTIKTGPKVFPMFGRSIACSGIITDIWKIY